MGYTVMKFVNHLIVFVVTVSHESQWFKAFKKQ